ncbi:hypothetical protein AL710_15295 [Clostridium botulinum]|uniref:hypothetical protein n=1 Tax=Clostridium botulinum TaxID=1491 RepID=UPI00099D87C7|nr:hypothetical protein [Clostridium botulinum]OPD18578.1 hypothetical protein AL710_15295 [Clostridium botulinum]
MSKVEFCIRLACIILPMLISNLVIMEACHYDNIQLKFCFYGIASFWYWVGIIHLQDIIKIHKSNR